MEDKRKVLEGLIQKELGKHGKCKIDFMTISRVLDKDEDLDEYVNDLADHLGSIPLINPSNKYVVFKITDYD